MIRPPPNYKLDRKNGLYTTDLWDDIRELTSGYFAGDEPIRTKDKTRFHKQQTSMNVLLRIILSSSKSGDTILDPFSGTGTTSLVATQLHRKSISIDNSPRNIDCIKNRIEKIRNVDRVDRFYYSYRHTKNLDEIWGDTKRVKRDCQTTLN